MNLQILSDIHLEFHKDFGKSFIDSIDSSGVDVLILAGDICNTDPDANGDMFADVLTAFCAKYRNVIFVKGNHEYFGSDFKKIRELLSKIELPNLHILDRSACEIDGQRFLGATLWYKDDPYNAFHMNWVDFREIKVRGDTAAAIYNENRLDVQFLRNNVESSDVVITHHLPSRKSVHEMFSNSDTNRFFICEMDDVIVHVGPKLWIHGHTHNSVDYMHGDTRVVCNPFGYPSELNPNFNERCILTV